MSGNDFHANPPEDGDEGYDEAYEAHRAALWDMLMAYADQHDLADGFLSDLVSDLGLSLRMVAYAAETERPSVGGLRLDLDRYAREMGESVREAKKGAGEFIAEAKAARDAEAAAEGEGTTAEPEADAAQAPEVAEDRTETAASPEKTAALTGARAFPRRQ
ncbi:Sec-independent protein translocase protein TatA [Ancylobacter sp. 3268]|uniref:hypothetical protein n=1 Tax=Ancylobacter sp. 3268 TaxID=2817752 RepID=UPI002865E578|nr:hypothetical protein [Ancylobacter sp. 3268]MDR6950994.1 Sec-independent protein translocase protein TatA [Ancylobacter sp. 3268]